MVEELDKETQEDPIPPLPKGFKVVKSSGGSDLPPLPQGYSVKKKDLASGDIGGTVGSSKAPSSVSTDPLQNQKRVFSGLNKAPISTSTPFSTGEVQKSEEKKPDNSIFNPANSVKHDIRELDTQELREYNKRSNAVETKPQVELIGQIKEERKDPAQQKKLALDYIADDMKESATSPIVDQHGLDVPQYFNSRKKEITSEIESINNETAGYRNALRLGEIKQPSPEAEAKIKRKDELTQKLSELNKYSNIYNQERAISDVNPSLSPDEKVIQIGRNLRKVNELDKVKKEESDIYNGVPVDKPEVKSIRDFNDELAGINALRSKTIEDYKSGTIPEDEAKAQLQFLKEKDNTLDEKYPAAAIESIRGLLSEDIANYRKQSNENAPKNSGGNLSYYWNNIVSAAPSKEEIKSSIDRARKSGAKISLDQENELMKDPDKFALTSMLGHLYHGSIVQADQAISGIDEERQKDFRDASVNQMEQPSELPAINEDGKVRMTANEKAGQKNPMGWGTLNNVAEVGGTIFNYIVANKGIGALSDAVLGGVAGAEVVGYGKGLKEVTKLTEAQKNLASNIGSSVLLNYSHNKEYAKTLTDNESEQDAYAMARSLITGLAFSELNPNKIISGVSASTEKNIAEKFLQQYKAGKGALNPDGMKKWFADVVINTAKDLGHNVTTIKADQLAGIALDRLTNKEAFQNRDVMNEMVGNLPSDVLALVPFSAIAGYKKSRTDIGIRNAVKLAISDPTKFESGMMDKVASGEIKKEDAEQKIGYIKELVKTSGGADMKSERVQALPENDQFKYAVNLAKESNLKSKSENITDKVQLDEHKRDINELTDERKAILNGTHDEYQSNVALFDRAYEKGTHNQTLDAGTKSEGVKYLSEQALTAPNSFKNQTGRDTELTTDLIALNPKEAIREEIKGWGDKIKPDATQAETESIQKHIDLLEAGLQKKSPKKEETPISFQKTEMKRRDIQPIGDNVPTPTEVSGKDVAEIEKQRQDEIQSGNTNARLIHDTESAQPLTGADENMANKMIEKTISKAKNTDDVHSFMTQLGWNLRGKNIDDFNQFVQDRIDGKTDKTFEEWRNENSDRINKINEKYDKQLADLEKQQSGKDVVVDEGVTEIQKMQFGKDYKDYDFKKENVPTSKIKITEQPSLSERKELVEDIKQNGIKEPIVVEYDKDTDTYSVKNGNNRAAIAKELGIKEVPTIIAEYKSKSNENTSDNKTEESKVQAVQSMADQTGTKKSEQSLSTPKAEPQQSGKDVVVDVEAQYNERKKSIEDKLNQQLEDNKDRLDDIEDKGGTKTVRQKIYQEHTNEMVELEKWKMKEDLKNEKIKEDKKSSDVTENTDRENVGFGTAKKDYKKANEIKDKIKSLRSEDGSISAENLPEYKRLRKEYDELTEENNVERNDRVANQPSKWAIDSFRDSGYTIGGLSEVSALRKSLKKDGYTNSEIEYIIGDLVGKNSDVTGKSVAKRFDEVNKGKEQSLSTPKQQSGKDADEVRLLANKVLGEGIVDKLQKQGYTIEKGKFDREAYKDFFGIGEGVLADEFRNAGLRLVKPEAKIKVYRGVGKNVAEGENEGISWVAEDKKVAENYSGDGKVEEVEISKPKNPFPNPTDTIHVKGSDVGNKLRVVRDKLFKEGKITKEQALEASKAIDEFVEAAGENSELYSTKTNKNGVSTKYVNALKLLGFDGIVQKESYNSGSPFTATKTGNETNTYGIFKEPKISEVSGKDVVVDDKPEIMYHSSKSEGFSEGDFKPIFFSPNESYSQQYGSGKAKAYEVTIKKPFDTADESARKIYNEEFLPYAQKISKGDKRYEPLKEGEKVPFTTADALYVFLRKSKREGKDYGYDGVIVDEKVNGEYSKFPLEKSQIKEQSLSTPKGKEVVQPSNVGEREVKEGFTEGKDLNKIYADLKAKYGDKKGAAIYEVANRLVNPNENTIVEIRGNGVVVKEGGKYILKPFGNTDANMKKWTLYKGLDVTDQFAKPSEPKTEPITNEKETTDNTNVTTKTSKEQPLVTDPTSKGETGKTEAEVRKAIEEAAASKKSENGKKVAMEEEAAKHGKVGEKVLADIRKEAEPPENNDSNENNGNEDWTHINKKDITEAEDLASKHPFGESETWKNSVKKGLDKLAKVAKKGESLYDAAKNKVNEWAAKVKQEILDDGKSTFNPSDEEIAQMAYHRTMTNKRIAELEPDLTSPIQAVRDAAEIVLGDLEAQKEMVDYVLHNTATTAGRAFNIRQMVSKIDAENGLQVKRMDVIRKQKGQPLSEKQEQELRDIHDEEVKNQKAKDEYAQKKAEKDFEEAVKLEVDRRMKAKKDKAASDKTNKPPTEKRAKIADKLNEWADKFEKFGRADLPDGTVKNSSGPDVQKMVSNAMRFVAEGVRDGKNIPEILKDAVKKFGESVLDHIKGGLRDIGITDREIEGDRQYALNEIKKLADKEKSDMLTKSAVGKGLVRELVNSHIDNGLTGKDVFTELNKDLKEIFPEITEQQVRDAYLKEGEFTLDKKENINKAKVDAKNELRSIAKNETDIADLKAERDLRKREREERQKTNYENQLIAEKKGLTDKKALTEKQEARLVELNKELDRIKQRKEKDAKVSNPKDLNRSDKEKAVLDEIKKEKEQWAKEKQAQRDLEVAAKKAQTAAKNEAERLKALTEKRDRLQRGQRDAPATNTPKVESTAIEQVKAEIKEADKKLREAESEANRINKEMQAKKDKLAEHEANIKRAENGLESIKTNRKKSDRQIDTDIADAETRLKKELNKQGLKLEKGSKAEKEQKQKVADSHNERVYKVIESIDTKLQDATLATPEKAALENAKKILEKSKINPDSKLDIFDAVDKAEKNTELARAELANSDKLSDVKREIANSQIQMGRDKLQTEQDILLQRHKDNLQKKINENERRLEAGEYVEKEPARLKTSDAESVRLEIKDRETKNKLNAVGKAAQREAMTKREKVIDTIQSLYVIGLVGRLSTLAKVGVSALTKQPLNTITSQTFGRLGSLVFPKINNALRGEGNEGWRKEKNRYMAHYGALGKEGMAKLISKGKENAQKADEAYINAKDKLEDIANKYGKDSKQYKDFEKGEFKKAEDKQKQALLDNVTNSIYEWIGGNAWGDAAEVFLHSSAKLEQLLGKGEKEMWADKTRKEKIMFVLSTSAATHGVLKNFSARAEFAANFVARLENKMKQGIDISKAEEILKTVNESYIAFQRGKYQEDNAITGGFKAGLEGLQRWAERHPDYKYAADLMAGALKFKNPIVRTPLNIAREAIVEYTIGVPLAIAKYRNSLKDARVDAKQFDLAGQEMKDHMKKFMDNIPADKADFIYRAFRKGGFGLGVMALTAMGGIQFGGFFNRDEKRRKKGDELGINEVEIGGQKLTHLQAKIFEHTSAFFPALLWSNYDRVRDENLKAGHGELGANLDAVMKDFQGMIDQIPIGNEMQNPLQGVQIPLIGPFLTEYAEATDVDANGEQIKRKPKGNPLEKVWQNIEMKIPGLRQNVPVSGKSSNWTEEDLKKPILKTFADKGAAKPDYTPSKISIKYVNGKPTQHLDSQTPEIQGLYIKNHQANYELELSKLSNGAYKVYKKPDGSVHIKGENTDEKGSQYTQFKDLTDEQVQYLEGQITRRATIKTKKQLHFQLDDTEKK